MNEKVAANMFECLRRMSFLMSSVRWPSQDSNWLVALTMFIASATIASHGIRVKAGWQIHGSATIGIMSNSGSLGDTLKLTVQSVLVEGGVRFHEILFLFGHVF